MSLHAPGALSDHLPLKPLDLGILIVLARGADYGYQIVRQLAEPEAGGIRLSPSNLYTVLDRMERAGLVEDLGRRPQEDRPPRRFFGITALGRAVLEAELVRMRAVVRAAGVGDTG